MLPTRPWWRGRDADFVIGGCLAGIAAVVGMAMPTAVTGGAIDLSRVSGCECCGPKATTDSCYSGDATKSGSAG